MSGQVEISGEVVLKPYAVGSKSEHQAVFIETPESSYLLRMQDGNPFYDPTLHAYVGK